MTSRPLLITLLSGSLLALVACGGEKPADPAPPAPPAPVEQARPADPPQPPAGAPDGDRPVADPPGTPLPPMVAPGGGPPGPGGVALTLRVKQHTDRMRVLANEAAQLMRQLDREAEDVAVKAAALRPGDQPSVRQMEVQSRQLKQKADQLNAKLQELQRTVTLVEAETDRLRNRAER